MCDLENSPILNEITKLDLRKVLSFVNFHVESLHFINP